METYYRHEQDNVEAQLLKFVDEDMQEAMPVPSKRMVDLIQKTVGYQQHCIALTNLPSSLKLRAIRFPIERCPMLSARTHHYMPLRSLVTMQLSTSTTHHDLS